QRLDDAIRRASGDVESARRSANRLMVRRVRRDVLRADDLGEPRAWIDLHLVDPVRALGWRSVIDVAGLLARDVLHQRSAERDVHDLRSATDREGRNALLVRGAREGDLVGV